MWHLGTVLLRGAGLGPALRVADETPAPRPEPSRGRRLANGRRVIAWTLVSFFALQCLFVATLDTLRPDIYDREAGVRLALLQERIREHPERPVVLVVGSSRIGLGFVPRELPPLATADGREAIPFNYSHLAAGPRMNLIQVHRVLRAGIKPGWVVLEILPGGLYHEGTQATMTTAPDLPVLLRHAGAGRVGLYYCRNRLNPFYKHRRDVLEMIAPTFATPGARTNAVTLEPLGDDLTWQRRTRPDDEARRAHAAVAVGRIYSERLKMLPIDPELDSATRELLAVCRDRGIPVVIVLTPEDGLFRSWYGPTGEATLRDYMNALRREYGADVTDARAWVPDEHFADPHHVTLGGASIFTERLGREVLRPLVAGQPRPPETR